MKEEINDSFLLSSIESFTKEQFDNAVSIFQKHYLCYDDVVNTDGTNDGGCDIKLYKNKRQIKKCVQVTIQKLIQSKLYSDLKKVDNLIREYGCSTTFDFYCTVVISNKKIEKYVKYAAEEYGIELHLYEAKTISQLDCKELRDYIYSLHSDVVLRPDEIDVDQETKALYDLLAHGRNTSDIKNGILNSLVVSVIYEKAPIDISELKKELEKRLGKSLPDISHILSLLRTNKRVIRNLNEYSLSEEEFESVKSIITGSLILEKNFINDLNEILDKYAIICKNEVLNDLKQLYRDNYTLLDDNGDISTVFEKFKNKLQEYIPTVGSVDILIKEIKGLCTTNSYLNRISASESFLDLYKSNKLEQYLNQKHKDIFLDTPTFAYLLCSLQNVRINDWDNPFYQSVKNLVDFQEKHSEKIQFYIIGNYLGEVAGEIQKALKISKFESFPFFNDLGGTRNTFFNYYKYLKDKQLFEEDINTFEDFLDNIGFDDLDVDDPYFYAKIIRNLNDMTGDLNIEVISSQQFDNFNKYKEMYEKQLFNKHKLKSNLAINNDVSLVLSILERCDNSDCYFATWDTTISELRNSILQDEIFSKYHYFNIQNPAMLSNRIALENFNIESSALTNEIFAYADKQYGIGTKLKSLLDLIAPILNSNGHKTGKLLKHLARIRKEQIEELSVSGESAYSENLPIEEAIIKLLPDDETKKKDDKYIIKFSTFMSDENNVDYILSLLKTLIKNKLENCASDLEKFKQNVTNVGRKNI